MGLPFETLSESFLLECDRSNVRLGLDFSNSESLDSDLVRDMVWLNLMALCVWWTVDMDSKSSHLSSATNFINHGDSP